MDSEYILTGYRGNVEIWARVYKGVDPLIDGTSYRFDGLGEKAMNMTMNGYYKLCSFSGAANADVFSGAPQTSIKFVGERWEDVGKEIYPDGTEKPIKALFYEFTNDFTMPLPWFLAIPSNASTNNETIAYTKYLSLYKNCIVRVDMVKFWHISFK